MLKQIMARVVVRVVVRASRPHVLQASGLHVLRPSRPQPGLRPGDRGPEAPSAGGTPTPHARGTRATRAGGTRATQPAPLLACFLLALLAMPLHGQLDRVFLDPAVASADYDAHLTALIGVMDEAPAGEVALTALRRAMKLESQAASMQPLYDWLHGHAVQSFTAFGSYADEYAEAYIELARRHAPDLLWHNVAAARRGITDWAFIGPFAEGFHSAHDESFPPEVMLDFAAEYRGAHGPVRWQPLRHNDPLSSRVDLWSQQRWSGAGYYIATALVSDAERELTLRLKLASSGKVWLNGEGLLNVDTRGQDWPEIVLPITLKRGRNLLSIKVSSLSGVSAYLRDNGAVATGVIAVTPKAGDPRQAVQRTVLDEAEGPYPLRAPEHHALLAMADGASARDAGLVRLALAVMFDFHGQRWHAAEQREAAMPALKDEPLAQLEFLRGLESSPLHTSSERRRISRDTLDALLAADAALVPALIGHARLLTEDQRYREAATLLVSAREVMPENWRLSVALAEVYRDADWRGEWLRELKHARKQAPDALPVLRGLLRHYATFHELANRLAVEQRVIALLPGDRDARLGLCLTLLRTGNSSEALEHARQLAAADPGSDSALNTLAETLIANGRLDEAVATFELLASRTARPEEYLQKAAEACIRLGREDMAEPLYERILQAAPGQHLARRQLQRMRGESENFWSEHSVSLEEALEYDVSAEDFPRADSALVLDEMIQIMYEDGSSLSYVNILRKVLTQDGVDFRGKERLRGELITARTIRPDGSVLEPISQAGGIIEYPGLEPGAYIHTEYLMRGDGGPFGTLDGERFYFMDPDFEEPFCISRWVLIAPASVPLEFVYHNMGAGDEGVLIEQSRENGMVTYIWDVRNPRHPEYEPFMPSALEFIPWVECVVAHDWRLHARKLSDDALPDTRVTSLIREHARTLTANVEGDAAKARVIYDWINTNFTTSGDAWNAHQALKAGAGDRRKLFIALCTAAGVELGFAYADSAPPFKQPPAEGMARPRWMFPRDEDFSTFLVVLWDEGKPIYINLDNRMRPFGALSSRLSQAPAILWRNGRAELTQLPGLDSNADRYENRAGIELSADGSARLSGSFILHGELSYSAKESMRNTPRERLRSQLQGALADYFTGVEAAELDFPGLDRIGAPLTQSFQGSIRRLARADGDELVLEIPGEKLRPLLSALVGMDRREYAMAWNFELVQTDELRIKPPEGYAFASIPRDLLYPTAPFQYALSFEMDGAELIIRRRLAIGPGQVTPADYPDIVEQVKRINNAESTTLRLLKTP